MMDITNTLLVVIDPTREEQHALGQAMVIAKKLQLDIELFICDYDSSLVEHQKYFSIDKLNQHIDAHMQRLDQRLDELAAPLREQNFTVSCTSAWDYPVDEGIIRQAMRSKPFLIVKDTHYHHKLTRAFLRNTDWSLIRTCPYPSLFVKPGNLWEAPTVTVAVSPIHEEYAPDELDKNLLQLGKMLSSKMKGKLNVYHSYNSILNLPMSTYAWAGQFNTLFTDELDQQIRQSHKQALYKLADEQSIDHNQVIMEEGEAMNCLPEFIATSKSDVLIIGTSMKSRFEQAFIGGTTESVLDEVGCDILVMQPPEFTSPVDMKYPPPSK